MKLRLISRQLIGVLLSPVALALLTLAWAGECAERLFDIILKGLDEMLGKP